MANLGSLTYDLIADTRRFTSGLDRAERAAKKRSRAIRNSFRSIGVAIASVSIGSMIKGVINTADSLDKLSTRLGVSVEALSQLRFAADISGISFEKMTMALQRSTRRIAEAAAGTGEAKNALKELNLSASELNKLRPDKQLLELARAFEGVENSADKVRLAMKLFDSEGVSMLQLLAKGKEGLHGLMMEANELGVVMSRSAVTQMVEFKDTMTRVSFAAQGLAQSLVISIGPALEKTITFVRQATEAFGFFLEKFGLWKTAIDGMSNDRVYAQMALVKDQIAAINAEIAAIPNTPPSMFQVGKLKELGEEYGRLQEKIKGATESLAGPAVTPTGVTGGGQTDASALAASRMAAKEAANAAELQMLMDRLKTEEQMEIDSHVRRLERLNVLREENAFPSQQAFLDTQFAEIQAHEDRVRELEEQRFKEQQAMAQAKAKLDKQELRTKQQNFRALISSAASSSKLMFNIDKAFALSDAILNFHAAVSGAYAVGAKLGGPPLGAAFAGIAAAAQAARIAAIAGTSFGGGSASDSGGGAGGAVPVAAADPNFGFSGNEPDYSASTNITINLGGATVFSDEAIRELIESINDQIDDGVVVKGIVVA